MRKENSNTEIAQEDDFDFFDFSDVDPFFAKRNAVANELLALISHENISRKKLSENLKMHHFLQHPRCASPDNNLDDSIAAFATPPEVMGLFEDDPSYTHEVR